MNFLELKTDLERLLQTDLGYYAGDPDVDSGTVDFDVERGRLVNWAYRTVCKLGFIVDPVLAFEPVSGQAFYPLQPDQGLSQNVYLGGATGGTFTLTFDGQTTAATAFDATAATLKTNLEALSNIGVGEATVTAVAVGFNIVLSGNIGTPPQPLMTIGTGSLTGTTGTPYVRQTGFAKRVVEPFHAYMNGVQFYNERRRPGLWRPQSFEREYPAWRDQADDAPRLAVLRGHQVQFFPGFDDAACTDSVAANWFEAQVIEPDMTSDTDIPQVPYDLHEGIPMLAAFRASDPTIDEQGALRRIQSLDQRWTAEVMEWRTKNMNQRFDLDAPVQAGMTVRI